MNKPGIAGKRCSSDDQLRSFGGLVSEYRLEAFSDQRGDLIPMDFEQLPFAPGRLFYLRDVPQGTIRGGHAHRRTRQLLFCLQGAAEVCLSYRNERCELLLDQPNRGLLIEPLVWSSQKYLAPDTVLLVLCDAPFDPDDYIQ